MSAAADQAQTDLLDRVDDLLDEVGRLVDTEGRQQVSELRDSLREPLRIAVVGRVSTGKSTLVNALIGRRVAPTHAGECTRVVTWYRAGSPEGADLRLRDGTIRTLPFVDDRLPESLDVPVEDVDRIDVRLQSASLEDYTLVDTPGLATLTDVQAQATRRALLGEAASRKAVTHADAILFLFGDAERRDDADFLSAYRAASGELGASAVNAIGLLARADVFGSGPAGEEDPFDVAGRVAAELARTHDAHLSDVLPVSGLLAEAANTGRIREQHALLLARLAAVDRHWFRRDLWQRSDAPLPDEVDRTALRGLVDIIGPYGVDRGRAAVAEGGAGGLLRWLWDRSGVDEVQRVLRERLTRRSTVLKVDHVLTQLTRLDVPDPATGVPGAVHDAVERARLDPALHRLRELRALRTVAHAELGHPSVADELRRLVDGDDATERLGLPKGTPPDEVRQVARQRAGDAQERRAFAVDPLEAEALTVLNRSYRLLADET